MKSLITICMAMVGLGAAAPAFAQHINPAGTTVTITGVFALNGQPCTLTIGINVNAAGTGGTTTAGSNTGSGACPVFTFDAGATLTVAGWNASTGTLTGTISGLVIRDNGTAACTGSIGHTTTNTPALPATPTGSAIKIAGSVGVCTVTMILPSSLTGSM